MLVEIRPGEGGDDAALFATELTTAITAHLRRADLAYTVDASPRMTVVTTEHDPDVMRLAGTHRIQRIPRNDPRGRRHTSTATVAVLEPTPALMTAEVRVRVEWFSGSGAGGQYRNRHPQCCRLVHDSGLTVVSTRHRSREQNERAARDELARRLAETAADAAHAQDQAVRAEHVNPERSGKGWTWNDQRGEVVDHATGRRYPMRAALRGDLPVQ